MRTVILYNRDSIQILTWTRSTLPNFASIDIPHLPNMQSEHLTPNQVDDIPTRLQFEKQFLQENPNERAITAARIYKLQPSTLYSFLERTLTTTRGGQNKILKSHEKDALHRFIRSLLAYGIQPTYQLVFNSICNLKRAEDSDNFKSPSLSWFSKW